MCTLTEYLGLVETWWAGYVSYETPIILDIIIRDADILVVDACCGCDVCVSSHCGINFLDRNAVDCLLRDRYLAQSHIIHLVWCFCVSLKLNGYMKVHVTNNREDFEFLDDLHLEVERRVFLPRLISEISVSPVD